MAAINIPMQAGFRSHLTSGMTGSPSTYIKEENDDFSFNPHQYMAAGNQKFNMNQQYGQFATSGGDMSGVNPSELTMGSMNGNFGMSNSFMGGGSGNAMIDDDELAALGNLDDAPQYANGMNGYSHQPPHSQGYFANGQNYTPDTNPISSPFVNRQFDFSQYANSHGHQQFMNMPGGPRRHPSASDARSPMTPTTPGMAMHGFGTPDSNNLQHQAHLNQRLHHHAKATASSWNANGQSGSAGSGWDSPLSSPHAGHFDHAQIEGVLKGSSLPPKFENGMHPHVATAEAKKKRRRESHNAVERRRRDNINERIHDLSRLVPSHRLEDEKIRKHLANNSPLSPTLGAPGMSPPAATSLLAGGTGRRAAGTITQGLPMEEKDKGPNKGDILNGAVSWTRDLMWQLNESYKNEEILRQQFESHGLQWPFQETEDQKRMKSELQTAVERNGRDNFSYSRYHGSTLRVPGHTTLDGKPLNPDLADIDTSPESLNNHNFNNGWDHRDSNFSLKEEDETSFGMEMG